MYKRRTRKNEGMENSACLTLEVETRGEANTYGGSQG